MTDVSVISCSEAQLREIFNRYGQVQTCIVNKEKRHAFVKMYFRKDAEAAKNGMEEQRNQDLQLRVRLTTKRKHNKSDSPD